jgi:hypothetical protein
MKWIKERDLLIAQTMAFVQSVAGKKPAAEARDVPQEVLFQSPLTRSTPVDEIAGVEPPAEALIQPLQTKSGPIESAPITRPSPVLSDDVRQEIRGRVAAFRAHQELFHRERDKYYNSVLTRFRTPTGPAPQADDHPSKP